MIFKQFYKYFSVGILNTLFHWVVFYVFYLFLNVEQSYSNLLAFLFAVVFSFFMNAKFTFQQKTSFIKFISYTTFMGGLSYIVGYLSDIFLLPPLFTLIFFSMISLVCGFFYSKYIVFRG